MKPLRFAGRLAAFVPYYLWMVLQSNWQVIKDVVTPEDHARPAVLKIPLHLEKPGAIFMLANCITMTPGTLSLDVTDDRAYLYVHVMFADNEDTRQEIDELQQRIAALFE